MSSPGKCAHVFRDRHTLFGAAEFVIAETSARSHRWENPLPVALSHDGGLCRNKKERMMPTPKKKKNE